MQFLDAYNFCRCCCVVDSLWVLTVRAVNRRIRQPIERRQRLVMIYLHEKDLCGMGTGRCSTSQANPLGSSKRRPCLVTILG